ncbi:hypothetical protein DE146DRAFT_642068 [Phaeosphaeria sp. MPI-PUGE-AT-0046c]|nr:hypothetical protein DE146DRAFT_642068 [Phaeosphaeria sp. MPI-PUGE-AT-0046c]
MLSDCTMAPSTSFLALSGEIRNLIYEHILEEISSIPAPDYTLRHLPHSRTRKFMPERQRSRSYLGLTQVCRLLRLEFKPLYIWPKPTVPFLDAPAYLEQYPLPDTKKSQQVAKTLRDLGKPVKMNDPTLVDILPLLKTGLSNLPFILSYPSDIFPSRSHNRVLIVNFVISWAYRADIRCQNCDCTDKVVKIGMRQEKIHWRTPTLKMAVQVFVKLDEEAMENLDEEQTLAIMRKVESHRPVGYSEVYIDFRMGSMTFDRFTRKWGSGYEKGLDGY